jgi:hypothetical protein
VAVDRDEFFALLEGLTPKEIEARLSLWDREELSLVQEYLEQKELDRTKIAQAGQADGAPSAKDAAKAAVEMAMGANMRATAALIISAGAMLAAVLSTIIALVGLRQ